jgi:hypothetical protein
MPNDPILDTLPARAAELKRESAALFAQHERLHVELLVIFERIKQLHYAYAVMGLEPIDPPPPHR